MKQLVVVNNKIVACGDDCYVAMGGTVICTNTGRSFDNATVVKVNCDIPSDIDNMNYRYEFGEIISEDHLKEGPVSLVYSETERCLNFVFN